MGERIKSVLANAFYLAILGVTLIGFQNCSHAPMNSLEGDSTASVSETLPTVLSPSEKKTQALLELNQVTTAQLSGLAQKCFEATLTEGTANWSCAMMNKNILQIQNLLEGLESPLNRIQNIATFSPEVLEYIQKYDSGSSAVKIDYPDFERLQMMNLQKDVLNQFATLVDTCQQVRGITCPMVTVAALQAVNISQHMLNKDVDLKVIADFLPDVVAYVHYIQEANDNH